MSGFNALWLPGTDHAGIATQMVVERELKETEKKSRHDLGREKFLERVWEWKDKYGKRISEQHKVLGASLDWSRERFTMDPSVLGRGARGLRAPVRGGPHLPGPEAHQLVPLLPHRAQRPGGGARGEDRARSGTSSYPVKGSDRKLTVATTRPETMLGDTAVAVHPEDERYTGLVGQSRGAAAHRPRDPHHRRRRAGGPGVRHRRGEGDPGPRLQRLPDGPAAQAADDHHPRRRRAHQQGGRGVRGPGALRGAQAGARGSHGAGPAGEGGAAQALRRHAASAAAPWWSRACPRSGS